VAATAVNNSAANWIENRHRCSLLEILGWGEGADKWLPGISR